MKNPLIYKVIVWRVISLTVAGIISWIWIGELKTSLTLTLYLTIVMMVLHYFFEIFWETL